MNSKINNEKISYSVTRRDFCKNTSCAVIGMAGISSFVNKCLNESILSKGQTMANIITAKVISQKGTCDAGHKVGDEVVFKEDGVEGRICIHALYSILPKVFAMMFDSQFPWLKDPNVSTSACPDAYNPLIFEISRKKED